MSILPPNSTKQERDLEAVTGRLSNVPIGIDALWNADACPLPLLPWLAWAFSVDDWDSDWTEAQKRDIVKRSIEVHKKKGTRGAVRDSLEALGNETKIYEPHELPSLAPFTFAVDVEIRNRPVVERDYVQNLDTIYRSKNVRSHLAQFRIATTVDLPMNLLTAVQGGEFIEIFPYFGGEESTGGKVYVGVVAIGYETCSVYPAPAVVVDPPDPVPGGFYLDMEDDDAVIELDGETGVVELNGFVPEVQPANGQPLGLLLAITKPSVTPGPDQVYGQPLGLLLAITKPSISDGTEMIFGSEFHLEDGRAFDLEP